MTRMLSRLALAEAIGETCVSYLEALSTGKVTSPAISRRDSNVRDVWEDTRLEAMVLLFRHGASDMALLADALKQHELFTSLAVDKPHLEFPHRANGDAIHDTLQALFQACLYLDEVGQAVGLPSSNFAIEFERKLLEIGQEWSKQPAGHMVLIESPPVMIEVLWDETTRFTKQVAIASRWGPSFEREMASDLEWARSKLTERGKGPGEIEKQMSELRSLFDRLKNAQQPDDLLPK